MEEQKEYGNVFQKIFATLLMLGVGSLCIYLGLTHMMLLFTIFGGIFFVIGLIIPFSKQVDPNDPQYHDMLEKKVFGENYETAKKTAQQVQNVEQMIRHPYRTLWNKFIRK